MAKLFNSTSYPALFLWVLVVLLACPEPPDEDLDTTISLSLDYAGLREVWLKISVEDFSNSWNFKLERDGEVVMTEGARGADTVVIDTGLNISTAYQYRAFRLLKEQVADSSNLITVNTMDSTSHSFSFVVDTLGESGVLWDVWAFDENNVWVVGEIFPTFGDPDSYNAAHWDGSEWELVKIQPEPYLFGQYTSVYGFSSNDMWFGSSIVVHWDGASFLPYGSNEGYPGGFYASSIWGTSSSNLYFVGDKGSIVHYDGSTFTKMESGTDIDLRDVTGVKDDETGEVRVWAGGASHIGPGVLLKLQESEWKIILDNEHLLYGYEYLDIGTVWAPDDRNLILYAGGIVDGIVVKHNQFNLNNYGVLLTNEKGFIRRIRGNGLNDFFMVGDKPVYHYNGNTFRYYEDVSGSVRLRGVAQIRDHVFIAGQALHTSDHVFVIRGVR